MSDLAWHVIQTKPRKEAQVYSYLCAQSVIAYYPWVSVTPVNPRASKVRAYFPGYLFVQMDLDAVGESVLNWIPGAVGLVQFGGEIASVPEHFIHELKRQVRAIGDQGGLNLDALKRGDAVSITSGPFAGYNAIFDQRLKDDERVNVFLDWLGRSVRVQVNANAISVRH